MHYITNFILYRCKAIVNFFIYFPYVILYVYEKQKKAFCTFCHDRIWGLGKQGFKCIQCKLLVHKKCHKLVQRPCGKDYSDITTDSGEVSRLYEFELLMILRCSVLAT
jgi:hypothetical protein